MVHSLSRKRSLAERLVVVLGCCAAICTSLRLQAAEEAPVDFAHQVAPIFRNHCVECHGGDQAKGGFSINTRDLFLDGGMAVPGDVEGSYFLELVVSPDPQRRMPPAEKPGLTEAEIAVLKGWVAKGMPWTDGFSFAQQEYVPPLRPRSPELPPITAGRDHPVDRFLDAYFRKAAASTAADFDAWKLERTDDATYLRRVYLDLVGLLPAADEVTAFVNDPSPNKRNELVQRLLQQDVHYAEHWLTFWNDLLRNDYSGTGFITGGRKQISHWLYQSLIENKPFDRMATELIAPPTGASRGFIDGIKWRGEVSAGQTLEIQFAQSISQSLLGINMKCASCHDSFIDRWKLRDAYGLAAIYADQPLAMYRCDKPTGETATPAWLFPELGEIDPSAARDERLRQLAALMTCDENGRFARTIVNRLWHQLMGRGIVHPVDAMQTPPWDADLLDFLATEFVANDYDLKETLRLIATSQAYQSKSEPVVGKQGENQYRFAGPRSKRMTAEQFIDAVWQVTGAAPDAYDAPLMRGKVDPEEMAKLVLSGKWIWSQTAAAGNPPPPEQLAYRKTFTLENKVSEAGAIITCDNQYTLYINGKQVQQDDDWKTVEPVPLTSHLQTGENVVVVIASNGGDSPNPAGLLFQANIRFADGSQQIIASDEQWQVYTDAPATDSIAKWNPDSNQGLAAAVVNEAVWSRTIDPIAKRQLAMALLHGKWMVRASLLKADALMRMLGRPNRDQIVTSRPNELTTLEAITLSNSQTLSDWFAQGADRFLARDWSHPGAMADAIFRAVLTREPTQRERDLVLQSWGSQPSSQDVQDVLWSLCVGPEFLIIR